MMNDPEFDDNTRVNHLSASDPWLEGYIDACDTIFRYLDQIPDPQTSISPAIKKFLANRMGLSHTARKKYGIDLPRVDF